MDSTLAATIARARDLQADALDDDIAGVVEEIRNGTLDAQAGRAIIWAHQWRAAKMRPKRYGDKIDHKHSGSLVIGIRQNERVGDEYGAPTILVGCHGGSGCAQKGGKARASKLTPEQRSEIARKAAAKRWGSKQ